jgi:UDP-N-acetylmuramoyl-tripeptide--D-alanyl-D-alanine ligase
MFNVKDLRTATGGVLSSSGVVPKRFKGISTDTRTLEPGAVFVALEGKNFDAHNFIPEALKRGARAVVYSNETKVASFEKGIAYLKVKDTLVALGDIARFHRERFDIPVIAITGSSGKTTTKEMVAWVLSGKYRVLKNTGTQNNLIGVPLTLLKIHDKHDVCVVEMGTNRMGEISRLARIARPNVGVITNIGPAHLEFLENLKGVYREKIALIKHLVPPGIAIVNRSDMILGKLARIKTQPVFCCGINRDAEFMATEITYQPYGISFTYNKTHFFEIKHGALHNVSNALVAIGCGLLFGMEPAVIRERLGIFEALDMRLKEVRCARCVVFDDSYNSNPQSLKHAIDLLCRQTQASRRVLVMGDMMELGAKSEEFHAYFGHYVSKKSVDVLITLGNFSRATAKAACSSGMAETAVHHFDACDTMLEFLGGHLKEGDVLLVKGSRSMRMERVVAYLKERG